MTMTITPHETISLVAYNGVAAREVVRTGGKLYLKLSTTGGSAAYNLTDFSLTSPGALDGTQVELGVSTLDVTFS